MSTSPDMPAIPAGLHPFIDSETGMLIQIPRREAKRALALDWVAQQLPAGATLSEVEINEAIAAVHDDTAAIRRYLVDSGRVTRPSPGTYVIPQ